MELGLDAVQGNLDGHEISHIFLPGGNRQISGGNGIQYGRNLPDVGPKPLNRPLKDKGQAADLVIGLDGDAALSAAVQAQVSLLQAAGHTGDLRQGSGDGLLQIRRQEEDAYDDDGKAHQGGPDDGHKNLMVGFRRGNAGKYKAVGRSRRVPGGDIGAQVFLIQDRGLAHITLPLLQHDLGQLGGQRGAHDPLSVLDHGGVGPRIPLKNGKLTAHAAFQLIQQLVDIAGPVRLAQNIIEHVRAVGTALFQHIRCQGAEHNHAHAHREYNGDHLHDDDHVAYLFADAGLLSFRTSL